MYFHKVSTPANFRFTEKDSNVRLSQSQGEFDFIISDLGEDVFKLQVRNRKLWKSSCSQATLDEKNFKEPSSASLEFDAEGCLNLKMGKSLLFQGDPDVSFGVCGKAWMMGFVTNRQTRVYGMGEKNNGFEKTGLRTKFWNTDVWADFDMHAIKHGTTDPMYVTVPYLLMKVGKQWLGVLVNNPFATFMNIGAAELVANQKGANDKNVRNYFGSNNGSPEVFFIAGATAAEVTRKLQRLCGTTPLPPLWSLGNNQCRWGYESISDLNELDENFDKHEIPCDGLWLDIDYMEDYKVFTFNPKHFPDGDAGIKRLADKGRHVVPILDPGVKVQPGYDVYESGRRADVFCRNPEGGEYVGFVWPGATAFPDFSLEQARKWWAQWVAKFAASGVSGAWLDMNDPSVGSSELGEMLFDHGRNPHDSYHNQYALGMQMASRDGFLMHNPNRRPFLLSRSGFISTSRYAAIWTGDNYSNYHHMRGCIAMTLNLALSGIPFNGPDVPGFGGDANAELARAWHKVCFLFPMFRNHTIQGTAPQEPWAFDAKTRWIVTHCLRLRYKLLPYLYNLFIQQEQTGEAILRPMFYEFANTRELNFDYVDDQFMVGPWIMQAPVLEEAQSSRKVMLPKGRWFDPATNGFVDGDRIVEVGETEASTPIFIREGAALPMQKGQRKHNANDLSTIEAHVFLDRYSKAKATLSYAFDDGKTFDYKQGLRSKVVIDFQARGNELIAKGRQASMAYKTLKLEIIAYGDFETLTLFHNKEKQTIGLKKSNWQFAGNKVNCVKSRPLEINDS